MNFLTIGFNIFIRFLRYLYTKYKLIECVVAITVDLISSWNITESFFITNSTYERSLKFSNFQFLQHYFEMRVLMQYFGKQHLIVLSFNCIYTI